MSCWFWILLGAAGAHTELSPRAVLRSYFRAGSGEPTQMTVFGVCWLSPSGVTSLVLSTSAQLVLEDAAGGTETSSG